MTYKSRIDAEQFMTQTKHYVHAKCYLFRAMTITRWSVANRSGLGQISSQERERELSLKHKRYFSRAIRPSSLSPRTTGISQEKKKFEGKYRFDQI